MAAEPLRRASWFAGAPPPGLGFPPSSAAGPWRPSELVPAEVNKYHVISLHFSFKMKFKDQNSETINMLAIAHRCLKSFSILQLPPSYEQVIREINQVQVNTTNNNNAAASPRLTITSATQTDFSEEIDNLLPQSNASNLSPLILT